MWSLHYWPMGMCCVWAFISNRVFWVWSTRRTWVIIPALLGCIPRNGHQGDDCQCLATDCSNPTSYGSKLKPQQAARNRIQSCGINKPQRIGIGIEIGILPTIGFNGIRWNSAIESHGIAGEIGMQVQPIPQWIPAQPPPQSWIIGPVVGEVETTPDMVEHAGIAQGGLDGGMAFVLGLR